MVQKMEKAGREYACAAFEVKEAEQNESYPTEIRAGKELVEAAGSFWENSGVWIKMQMASAYAKGLLSDLTREFFFDKQTGELWIRDSFSPAFLAGQGEERKADETQISVWEKEFRIQETLVTRIMPEINGNRIVLRGKKGCNCFISINESVHLEVSHVKHANHEGKIEDVYIIRWDVKGNSSQFKIKIV